MGNKSQFNQQPVSAPIIPQKPICQVVLRKILQKMIFLCLKVTWSALSENPKENDLKKVKKSILLIQRYVLRKHDIQNGYRAFILQE